MKYHALFVNFEKQQNLKLSPAANYRSLGGTLWVNMVNNKRKKDFEGL